MESISAVRKIQPIPTLQSLPNFANKNPVEEDLRKEKIDLTNMKIPVANVVYVPEQQREARAEKHCEQIYRNLADNVTHSFFKDENNKDQIMLQLKQQMEYIYARRYGKKRIG
jgi:hypothetical protein